MVNEEKQVSRMKCNKIWKIMVNQVFEENIMQITINVPDTLPQAFLKQRIQEVNKE